MIHPLEWALIIGVSALLFRKEIKQLLNKKNKL
jgi:hypothetical protein